MEEKILVPFAPILIESTRSIGYSFESAIADIIDNSISKGAKQVMVNYRSIANPYIAIIDDAIGMDVNELEVAMQYGSRSSLDIRDEDDLGRFGLGLKMASLSQCRKLTVISKKNGVICGAKWDLDFVIKKENWVLKQYNQDELRDIYHIDILQKQKSGTIVLWEDFDRLINGAANVQKVFDEKIELAREHIALVFHRFMDINNLSKRLKIYFNGSQVQPIDPFLANNPGTQPLTEQSLTIDGSVIKVKPFILPYISKISAADKRLVGGVDSLRQSQGFYVYRNKRLIIWGTWFKLIKQYELNKLARIRVDIPNTLDAIWEIDVKKATASLPDLIKKNLIAIVENSIGVSERVYKYRGRKVENDSQQHVWNKINNRGKYQYLINRELQIYRLLEEILDEEGAAYLDTFIKIIEDAFPYSAVYYDLAKNESNIQEISLENDEVYKMASFMISQLSASNGEVSEFLNNLDKIDFFIKYPDVIKMIREEFKNECEPEQRNQSCTDAS